MKKISVSFYQGGEQYFGETDGHNVFYKRDGKNVEAVLSAFFINWIKD